MIKVGNDSFRQTQFGPNASETISQRRFLLKKNDTYLNLGVCPSSVSINEPISAKFKSEKERFG
jgi:hypothetical protein